MLQMHRFAAAKSQCWLPESSGVPETVSEQIAMLFVLTCKEQSAVLCARLRA